MKAVIMAGGGGTRLWPLSRSKTPKQAQPILGNQSLLQNTVKRIMTGWKSRDIVISTNHSLVPSLQKQLPKVRLQNFIAEPIRRDTSAAIGLVAAYLHHRNPGEVMFTVNSDHFVKDVKAYVQLLKAAGQVVNQHPNQTVLIGTKPTFPDTSSGYIKTKRKIGRHGKYDILSVDRFIEKPDIRHAKRFIATPNYLLNPAWFVFRVDAMLNKFRRWLPTTYRYLQEIENSIGTVRETATVRRLFPKMEKISIDYGIMEKDEHMLVMPSKIEWFDIGSWHAVYQMQAKAIGQNILRGRHITHNASGNLLYSYSGKLIAATGVHNMVIIETKDAILVCPRDRAQEVKQLVALMEEQALHKYL